MMLVTLVGYHIMSGRASVASSNERSGNEQAAWFQLARRSYRSLSTILLEQCFRAYPARYPVSQRYLERAAVDCDPLW